MPRAGIEVRFGRNAGICAAGFDKIFAGEIASVGNYCLVSQSPQAVDR